MDRRASIALLGLSAVVSPPAARAQQALKPPAVGVLNSGTGPRTLTVDIIRDGLRELGYVDGRTIALDVRFASGKADAFPDLAADLVRRRVAVLAVSGPAAVRAAKNATSSIPIVALDLESDPVEAGFARSVAKPGGNITGCFLDQPGLTGKWLELIGEAVPGTRRIAVLVDTATGPWQLAAIKKAAEKLKIELDVLALRSTGELGQALAAGVKNGSQALVQLSSPLFDGPFARRIVEFTLTHRLPAISMFRRFPEGGGLMSYGPNQSEYTRRLPIFIDKILKGATPGDLPIEQPTKFDLVINLKTAKALGLSMPPSLLARADRVIE